MEISDKDAIEIAHNLRRIRCEEGRGSEVEAVRWLNDEMVKETYKILMGAVNPIYSTEWVDHIADTIKKACDTSLSIGYVYELTPPEIDLYGDYEITNIYDTNMITQEITIRDGFTDEVKHIVPFSDIAFPDCGVRPIKELIVRIVTECTPDNPETVLAPVNAVRIYPEDVIRVMIRDTSDNNSKRHILDTNLDELIPNHCSPGGVFITESMLILWREKCPIRSI